VGRAPTTTDVLYAAMLFAAAAHGTLPPLLRSELYDMSSAPRSGARTPEEQRLCDAYFELTEAVPDRGALLARLHDAYRACEPKNDAELRAVARRLAPVIKRTK
jgi:hypothetical protein